MAITILNWEYFNPRSHKGSDGKLTFPGGHLYDFNPRSHKGSDRESTNLSTEISDFNPRSHKGSDPGALPRT